MKPSFIQETDSKMVFHLPDELTYGLRETFFDETYGGKIEGNYSLLFLGLPHLEKVQDLISKLPDENVAREAKRLLSAIKDTVIIFQQFQSELVLFPELEAHLVSDGSILFEWIFPDYRVGFSIDPNLKESSWYLATKENLGHISASGLLLHGDLNRMILWLMMKFILSHS